MLEQIKHKEAKLKEAEATVILADVGSYNMTPEQLSEFLKLAASGRLDAILKNTVPVTNTRTPIVPDDEEEFEETEENEDEE